MRSDQQISYPIAGQSSRRSKLDLHRSALSQETLQRHQSHLDPVCRCCRACCSEVAGCLRCAAPLRAQCWKLGCHLAACTIRGACGSCAASVDMCFYCKCGLRPVILKYGIVRVVYALEFLLSTVQILRRSTLSRWSSFAESFAHHFWRKTNLLHTHVLV